LTLSLAWIVLACGLLVSERGRRWTVSRRFQILTVLASIALSTLVFDAALTITGRVPTVEKLRKDSINYLPAVGVAFRMQPDQDVTSDAFPPIRINNKGFRGPDIDVVKPASTTRVIVLGGSQVFGYEGINWPLLAGEILANSGHNVEIINAAVPGHRSADSLGKLYTDLWTLDPDVIFSCEAWNDSKYFAALSPSRPYVDLIHPQGRDWRIEPAGLDAGLSYSALYRLIRVQYARAFFSAEGEPYREPKAKARDWGLQQYRLNNQLIVDAAHNMGAQAVLCKQARLFVEAQAEPGREVDPATRRRLEHGYRVTGLPQREMLRAFESCDRIIDEVAAQKRATVIDMNGPMSGKQEYFLDHVHLSPDGAQKAADLLAAGLLPLLDSARPSPSSDVISQR
jgi:lysophospholipase L1-like esterase